MKRYSIEVSRTAERQLNKLERREQIRVIRSLERLASDPRPSGCRKLTGYEAIFRIRVGTLRIVYEIDDEKIIVAVMKLGHRKDIYR